MPLHGLHIRERLPDETRLFVDIHNAAFPPDARMTVEERQAEEKYIRAEDHPLFLVGEFGGRPIATGATYRSPYMQPGRFRVMVTVLPEWRRQGFAQTLYDELECHARNQRFATLVAFVHEHCLIAAAPWLERLEYRITERMRKGELGLDTLDQDFLVEAEKHATSSGIALVTFDEQDSRENRLKLWHVYNTTRQDVPHDHVEEEPFDKFEAMLATPECLHDCLVVAKDRDEYAGFSILGRETGERAVTWMTGVRRDYRGRGVALALKARSALLARDKGFTAMSTMNHINNPAMLAVNTRIGYRPLPERVLYRKDLSPIEVAP